MNQSKYKIGDKIIANKRLITVIDRVVPYKNSYMYYFKDKYGDEWKEVEEAVELNNDVILGCDEIRRHESTKRKQRNVLKVKRKSCRFFRMVYEK